MLWSEFINDVFNIGIIWDEKVVGICLIVFGLNSDCSSFCGFVLIIFFSWVVNEFVCVGSEFKYGISLFVNKFLDFVFIMVFSMVMLNVFLIEWKNWLEEVIILSFFFEKFFCKVSVRIGIIRFIFRLIIVIYDVVISLFVLRFKVVNSRNFLVIISMFVMICGLMLIL